MKRKRMFQDTETGIIISYEELAEQYAELQNEEPETYDYSLERYILDCCSKNGFLKEIY